VDEPNSAPPYSPIVAAQKFERARSRNFVRTLLRLFSQKPDRTLLSFDQVSELLRGRQEIDRGTQMIPISNIVGSVGRYRDFDRAFLPLDGADEARWKRLDIAMNELRSLPPIEVYGIGEVYFVRDGNHRVSVAKANGLDTIEAHVTEVESRVPITPEVNIDDLIIKAEYARFLEATHLDATHPEQKIEITEPGRHRILLEHIEVHRYYLGLMWEREPSIEEAAASWYDTVYLPVVEAMRETEILKQFPSRTEADLYLWIAYHRELLKERYGEMPLDRDVAAALAEQFSERPIARFVRMITRAASAAVRAAAESPEPPAPQSDLSPLTPE
jgi:hypothetical protein